MKILLFTTLLALPLSAQEGSLDPERIANTIILNEMAVINIGIETALVEEITFEKSVFAIGRIEEIPSRTATLSSRIAGRIVALDVYEGDTVQEGQVIARIESRQPGSPPPTIKLVAPRAGLITESHLRLGQPVEPGTELLTISDRSTLWAIAKIPEQVAAPIKVGTSARIQLPALGETSYPAQLARFGVSADRASGTLEGVFELSNGDGNLRPGMRAEFALITSKRENVLAIPRAALQGTASDPVVFVKDFDIENAFLRAPIVIGEQNEQYAEVISGLFPGDEIVTTGSYPLSFAGGGNGPSLKEALDAAHGHEHNANGSEMSGGEEDDHSEDGHGHGATESRFPLTRILFVWATVATLFAIVFAQISWNANRKPRA